MSTPRKYVTADWIKDNGTKIMLAIAGIVVGVFFYGLNVLYPVYLDDWFYTFNLDGGEKIDGFISIFHSQYAHYFEWGGRVVLHSIAQALLWFGKSWADVLNTLAYLVLTFFIYFIANKKNKANPVLFVYINIFIWFVLPSLSQNLLWKTGSANYLWGGVILFGFIYNYVSYYIAKVSKDGVAKSAGLLFFGILAGWTNENMSVALLFFLAGLILLLKYQRQRIPTWMLFGLAGAVIGCVLMLLSPGNMVRSKNDLWVAHQLRETDLSFYFYRFVTVTKLASSYLLYSVLIYAALSALYWWKGKQESRKEIFLLSMLFVCTSAVATAVMAGSPMFPERAWFGILILLVIAAMLLYANIDFSGIAFRSVNYVLFAVVLIVYVVSCKDNYVELSKFSEISRQRDQMIIEERNKGVRDIVIYDHLFQEKQSCLIVLDLQDWLMLDPGWDKRIGKYYGVNTVVFKEKNEGNL
ncbi:hypothetical protein M2451_000346 [Dysgonomonas sp. PFB1-18]|uniref:DUF3329 domain-containing protein n=1 Tax=unclassified Dysgonomonas TaxID=2630389 RepID=UPI002474B1D5|nr:MULTISPECIES: DUF6056 family protein [unclassified Dysgonomonas]MDH6307897.1 hypothetical protein [Dysgonomonas sp. PF1-14]MDH6337815.1 hypothetical protein [Dysgonomonas sp. PF1-16]MDH6379039.1 hypothetical protein [Dysgonomonas sp. PFB1-18]MDH6396674.1 hypothetical protein [Dysgonomonas sp. PF1-23]